MFDNCLPPISALEVTPAALACQPGWVRPPVTAPSGQVSAATLAEMEEVDDEEHWLWQLVDDANRAIADAPKAPSLEELNTARRAVAAAVSDQRRAQDRVRATEVALTGVRVWLRPRQRVEFSARLGRARAALVAADETRDAAERALREMKRRSAQVHTNMAAHRRALADADCARGELDRRVDNLIAAYVKAPDPPAWFRFGLGYPPRAQAYPQWLDRARAAVVYRRRHRVDHPLEPTGRPNVRKGYRSNSPSLMPPMKASHSLRV
jgi:hypothetical protein